MLLAAENEVILEHVITVIERVVLPGFIGKAIADIGPRAQFGGRAPTIGRHDPHGGVFEKFGRAHAQGGSDIRNRIEFFILEFDQFQRAHGGDLVLRRDGGDGITHIAQLVHGDDGLVLDEIAIDRL